LGRADAWRFNSAAHAARLAELGAKSLARSHVIEYHQGMDRSNSFATLLLTEIGGFVNKL
jgi:hypothetical protein